MGLAGGQLCCLPLCFVYHTTDSPSLLSITLHWGSYLGFYTLVSNDFYNRIKFCSEPLSGISG